MSVHKCCQPSTKFVICILTTMLGQSIILLLPLPQFSDITDFVEVVVKLVLRSKSLHVLIAHGKVLRFALCNKSFSVFFSQIFVHIERVCLVPPTLHKPALIGPPSMRDDLQGYLLPLLLQLFRIFNVCLNSIFKDFVLIIFAQVIDSLQG
jgi:hypothetical protein